MIIDGLSLLCAALPLPKREVPCITMVPGRLYFCVRISIISCSAEPTKTLFFFACVLANVLKNSFCVRKLLLSAKNAIESPRLIVFFLRGDELFTDQDSLLLPAPPFGKGKWRLK